MTGRIEKTVFISYRRANKPWALFIYQNLTNHGYDVFIDFQNINSGNFEIAILDNIRARAHFVVVLTPSALENCKSSDDWLRREIEAALDEKRNIVPLMVEGFDFGSPLVKNALTGKLATLSDMNGLRIPDDYPFEAMDRLRERYLNVALSDFALPTLQKEAQEITNAEKTAANEAAPVSEEQLTAQTWYERGYVFQESENWEEAIRSYTEAIRLEPNFLEAYGNRGIVFSQKGDLVSGFSDFNKVLELDPNEERGYNSRGGIFREKGEFEKAILDVNKAIRLKPDFEEAYFNRALIWEDKKDYSSAIADYQKYLKLGGNRENDNQKEIEEKIEQLKRKLTKKKPKMKRAKQKRSGL